MWKSRSRAHSKIATGYLRDKGRHVLARILVIDDEEAVRIPLRTALELAGHQVREAEDGTGGLAQQQASPADLVITDLNMPGLAGDQLVKRLKADFPATKIIAISALDGDPTARLGVDCAIPKPFRLKDVLARIADLMTEE